MRIMALDIGKVRCGIAISDPQEKIATPLCVLPTEEVRANAPSFRRLCEDWEPELIVSGLPFGLMQIGEHVDLRYFRIIAWGSACRDAP